MYVRPSVGSFVATDHALVEMNQPPQDRDAFERHVRKAVTISGERSPSQDPLFGVRQLVDIALRGLSPGINDPRTAEYALYYLGDALLRLAQRKFPDPVRVFPGNRTQFIFTRPTWDDYVTAVVQQIRISAANYPKVLTSLINLVCSVAAVASAPRRSRLLEELEIIESNLGNGVFARHDREELRRKIKTSRDGIVRA